MEALRDANIEARLTKQASDPQKMMHSSWLRSLNGEEYGRLYAWGNKPDRKGDYESASPCIMCDLPQTCLEPVLVDEASRVGATFRFYNEFVQQKLLTDGRIETTIRDRLTHKTYSVTSNFLIGADGAKSAVLESLEIPLDGQRLNAAFNVHIKADLTKYLKHRPGSLNWVLNPDAPEWSAVGNFRMVRPWDEFVVSMHPGSKYGAPFEPSNEDILKRLYQMIGDDKVAIKILSSFQWTVNNQVARSWQRGNVICLGDATHRHPPINGLGSNTCIGDAFNIAWKLAFALKGLASPKILESITVERKPVGDAIVKRAIEGMEDQRRLWNVIGLTNEEREAFTRTMEEPSEAGRAARKAWQDALEKMDDEIQALGIQMNQVYVGSPLTVVEAGETAPDFSHINPIKQLMVSTYPGYHLPHVWLARDGQSDRVSTLDLSGRGTFTLFTGCGGGAWKDAAREVSAKISVEIRAYSIGFRLDYMDVYRDWVRVRGIDDDGAVLIRPDHFVGWRCQSMAENPLAKLEMVMSSILGFGE